MYRVAGSGETAAEGVRDSGGAGFDPEFGQQVGDMPADGPRADRKCLGNFPVGAAVGQQVEDIELSPRQRVRRFYSRARFHRGRGLSIRLTGECRGDGLVRRRSVSGLPLLPVPVWTQGSVQRSRQRRVLRCLQAWWPGVLGMTDRHVGRSNEPCRLGQVSGGQRQGRERIEAVCQLPHLSRVP